MQGGWDTGSQAALAYDIAGGCAVVPKCSSAPRSRQPAPARLLAPAHRPLASRPPASALRLRGEGTALNFHPAHYRGVAQELAGQGLEAVVAALRALSRGGAAACQQSSRFRGVSRHQKVRGIGADADAGSMVLRCMR